INNKVAFNLETASSVELSVYTPMGMLVRRLETGRLKAGVHTITLKNLTSGFYFVSLKNGNLINTKTMLAR
ncbi:MAG: T9SS type A sorting domain-containing protein, partial [Fibrobacter sp.]|nr:T9SS type A sorting domain-containing protein [Fibrobacter sp.]